MTVRVRGLQKSFKRNHVLRGIDLDVAPGEVVGLIGPNGAGKTSLMSCLLGYLFPDSGQITIDGRSHEDLAIRARTGFVPERMNFDRASTGRSFLRYMARLAKVENPDARVDELMERLGIRDAADKRLAQYSRGMLQRTVMCQALLHHPDFLFLDEPASGLDPHGVMLVRDVIAEQRARGAAVLLNSHQLAEVERVCDRVLFLSKGSITEQQNLRAAGAAAVVIRLLAGSYDSSRVQQAVGVAPENDIVEIAAAGEQEIATAVASLVATGAGVIDVRRRTADLEEIFRRSA
jgi:ABC-2 type transport system ATP-binding protein